MKPQPGDRIEISRGGFLYEHWAVYVGDGYIVHLTVQPGPGSLSGKSNSGGTATVKKEKLQDVVGNKWRINNNLDKDKKPRPANVIVREACALVGRTVKYRVFSENCEHFVNELRYGASYSRQVQGVVNTLIVGGVTAATVVTGAVVAPLVIGAGAIGLVSILFRRPRK